jgi:hypothetical protein
MINKPRPHRLQLLNLIDHYKLSSYQHSLCWKTSPVATIPVTDFRIGNETIMDQGVKNGNYCNARTYQDLLQTRIFEPSCVSIITEPAYNERETIVTEKTIMAIYGGTIPIWVGGWRIADYMSKQGFDVFDDIVNHSYQSLDDPAERCRRAVVDNIELLKTPVQIDVKRLQHNLDLVKSNLWINQVNSFLKIYPDLRTVWPA